MGKLLARKAEVFKKNYVESLNSWTTNNIISNIINFIEFLLRSGILTNNKNVKVDWELRINQPKSEVRLHREIKWPVYLILQRVPVNICVWFLSLDNSEMIWNCQYILMLSTAMHFPHQASSFCIQYRILLTGSWNMEELPGLSL